MRHFLAATAVLVGALALAAAPARGAEATFERTLAVNGTVDLTVATGAGSIHLTQGPANRVHIFGRVRSSWGANEARVGEIAAHPPIEQTGNIVRIGSQHEDLHNISIDYEIEAPAGAYLNAGSGSGSVTDSGVGVDARLHTGSGSIHVTGLQGGYSLSTGSGSIEAEGTGEGDVTAGTGSGTIDLRGVNGGLRAPHRFGHHQGAGNAGWAVAAGHRLRERGTVGGQRRLYAGRRKRLGRHSRGPADDGARQFGTPPRDGPDRRGRADGADQDRLGGNSGSLKS